MRSWSTFNFAAIFALAFAAASFVGVDELHADDQPPTSPIVAKPGPASQPQKDGFTLFNPTPQSLMRGFNSDRPSVTESPFTVDAGHLQAEFSFVEYTYDYDDGSRTDAYSVAPFNIRVGLLNYLELDVMLNPYINTYTRDRFSSSRMAGIGDTQFRAKLNLWGNDGGVTAFGLLPYINLPTASNGLSNHQVEGGLILPLNVQLPAGFDLGTMMDFGVHRNAANDGYGLDLLHSITLGHELIESLTAYVEYVGIAPVQTGRTYLAYFDTGMTYAITNDLQVDLGINIGLSRHANDFTVFSGLSFRI
jgi:hypothetical protein